MNRNITGVIEVKCSLCEGTQRASWRFSAVLDVCAMRSQSAAMSTPIYASLFVVKQIYAV